MMIKDKVILVDCDGVILDWEYAYDAWMIRHGYEIVEEGTYKMEDKFGIPRAESKKLIRMFNESAAIANLPPLRDAIKYIKKLHEEHGYVFHAITSLSLEPAAGEARTMNLKKLFGETAFERFVYLDTGADKDEALAEYEGTGCFWLEDKPENAITGKNLGLNALLVAHDHNADVTEVPRVENWKEIYGVITN